jgi:hypothetical protein
VAGRRDRISALRCIALSPRRYLPGLYFQLLPDNTNATAAHVVAFLKELKKALPRLIRRSDSRRRRRAVPRSIPSRRHELAFADKKDSARFRVVYPAADEICPHPPVNLWYPKRRSSMLLWTDLLSSYDAAAVIVHASCLGGPLATLDVASRIAGSGDDGRKGLYYPKGDSAPSGHTQEAHRTSLQRFGRKAGWVMTEDELPIGTVVSDESTPTFEVVRIKLKAGKDIRPNTLVRIPVSRSDKATLIGRVRSAYEHNPNEGPQDIHVRDSLKIKHTYPAEEESTIIYRVVEADLVEEIVTEGTGTRTRSPQTLPQSGAEVFVATDDEIVQTLGLLDKPENGLPSAVRSAAGSPRSS